MKLGDFFKEYKWLVIPTGLGLLMIIFWGWIKTHILTGKTHAEQKAATKKKISSMGFDEQQTTQVMKSAEFVAQKLGTHKDQWLKIGFEVPDFEAMTEDEEAVVGHLTKFNKRWFNAIAEAYEEHFTNHRSLRFDLEQYLSEKELKKIIALF